MINSRSKVINWDDAQQREDKGENSMTTLEKIYQEMPERAWFDFRGQKQDAQRLESLWGQLAFERKTEEFRVQQKLESAEIGRGLLKRGIEADPGETYRILRRAWDSADPEGRAILRRVAKHLRLTFSPKGAAK